MNCCLTCGAPSTDRIAFPTGTTLCRECLTVVWHDRQEERNEAKVDPVKFVSDDDDMDDSTSASMDEDEDDEQQDRRETKNEPVKVDSDDDDEDMGSMEKGKVGNIKDDKR